MMISYLFFCLFGLSIMSSKHIHATASYHDYCIIGAGPGGLQMGYFLMKQNRSYIIFERSTIAGSFFINYPRHRKLISINKRHTGKINREFNLRHDWNSLLSDDEDLLFTEYSKEYFPHADHLLRYFGDYASKLALNIQYNTDITKVIPEAEIDPDENLGQYCKFLLKAQNGMDHCCSFPIIATGLQVPGKLDIKSGEELIEYYDKAPIDGENYEGQNVLVIGRGNSGMEVISGIYGNANFIHSLARSRVKLSWETHYVGDIRGVNTELLDSYMLKSLDGVLEANSADISFAKGLDGKIRMSSSEVSVKGDDIGDLPNSPVREGYDRVVGCLGFSWNHTILNLTGKAVIPNYKQRGPDNNNREMYTGKYPDIDDKYESLQIKGLFFAGTMTHSLDWRKSAGGFIHGLRYTVRGLHRLLEWRNHNVPWPSRAGAVTDLTSTVLKRANEASGIYQMFTVYCDVVIVHRNNLTFTYMEEFPYRLLPNLVKSSGHGFIPGEDVLFVLSLEYGPQFSRPGSDHFGDDRVTSNPENAEKCNFLHPVIRCFKQVPADGEFEKFPWEDLFRMELNGWHHVVEDFTTSFDSLEEHVAPLRRFFEFHLSLDLKPISAESCMIRSLLAKHDDENGLPVGCRRYF